MSKEVDDAFVRQFEADVHAAYTKVYARPRRPRLVVRVRSMLASLCYKCYCALRVY